MFNAPFAEINFDRVVAFCKEWPEGVRVDYKAEPANIGKVVSSFANTSGGILIIGVRTDTNNMPILPLVGYSARAGIEEQITQSCYQGIYPPIVPLVKVIPFPSDPSRVLAIVKVHESIEAPHAIENSTRVYIRVNSTSDHVALAHIDRIEFLFSRRLNSEERRDKLFQKAFARTTVSLPRLRVTIGPHYPDKHVLDLSRIQEIFPELLADRLVNLLGPHTRLIQNAVVNTSRDSYTQVNLFGQLFHDSKLRVGSLRTTGGDHFDLVNITLAIASSLHASAIVLARDQTNLLVKVALEGIRNHSIIEDPATVSGLPPTPNDWMDEHKAVEETAEAEVYTLSETLKKELGKHVVELIRQLMWAFNWADDRVERKVLAILRHNHYLPPD